MRSNFHRNIRYMVVLAGAVLVTACASSPTAAEEAAAGDATEGHRAFNRTCRVCHQVEAGGSNSLGPVLAGLAGHAAGVDSTFDYSDAFNAAAAKGLVWDQAALDRFLAGPTKMIPGTKMPLSVANADQRADIVAYLATLEE